MNTIKSLAIISCYMGNLPWYFDYFAHTCKYNPSVHFIIITDDRTYSKPLPENIFLVYKTLKEVNAVATDKLGFKTNINSPYKLCDFKPTYGLLFSDLLKGYDFWGHGDIDIIFGNIRSFITDDLLTNYDLIAVRHDFLTGYFLLFRNNEKMKMLFKHSKDYEKVLSSERHCCFDETNFHFREFETGTHYSRVFSDLESMTHIVKRLAEEKFIKAYFDFHVIEGAFGKLSWNKGKLMFKNKYEALLYHMILFKTIFKPKKRDLRISDCFQISPSRIYIKKLAKPLSK